MYLNFDDPRLLVLIFGYQRFLTSFICLTLGSQGEGHGGNGIGWVGARHLYFNFDDPRLLVLISGYPRFLTSFFCMTLGCLRVKVTVEMTLNGWAPANVPLNFDDPRLGYQR